jgi:TIR domain/IrrE N-terminal-like domain
MARFVRKWVLEITNSVQYDIDIELCAIKHNYPSLNDNNLFVRLVDDRFRLDYGIPFIGPMMLSPRTNWEAIAVLAHEIGHIVLHVNQFKEVDYIDSTRKRELEADEFSGYVLAKLGVRSETVEIFRKYGDNQFADVAHHGTPVERRNAAWRGFKKAKIGLAYDAQYVPYFHDVQYALVSSRDGIGIIGALVGGAVGLYASFLWVLRRMRKRQLSRTRLFISYRRQDTGGEAGRIFDRLKEVIPARYIFMDVDSIDAGVNFGEAIRKAVAVCDVLLAVIGERWISVQDGKGIRRLDDPEDYVRAEIGAAFNAKIRIIPVLINETKMPSRSELPPDLEPLVLCNAVEIRHSRFDADVEHLIFSLGGRLRYVDWLWWPRLAPKPALDPRD